MHPKILIADNEVFLEVDSLSTSAYSLIQANSASEMIAAVGRERPTVAVVDFTTAKTQSIVKGKTLVEWLHHHYKATTKFVVTTDAAQKAQANALCLASGASCLDKPCSAKDFLAFIQQVLRSESVGVDRWAALGAPAPAAKSDKEREHHEAEYVKKIEDFIYNLTGIKIPRTHNLPSTIRRRMEATCIDDMAQYFSKLTTSREEAQTLTEEVTINETFFFRNTGHFDCIRDVIYPELISRGHKAGRKEVAIWSAACSTGEEPYSLAILARHVFPADWRVRIHASDIDSKVIRFAQHGVYPHTRVARTPEAYSPYLMRFLRGTDEGWGFEDEIKGMVQFRRESIFDANVANLDLILCRNVMIYFDDAGIARMAEKFDRSLREGGYLIIGHSEFLRRRPETLRYARLGGVSLHVKTAAAQKAA